MKLPFEIDLSNKTAVVTGGGGILCSGFSKVLAQCGAKVAVLDLRGENASAVADEINKNGGTAPPKIQWAAAFAAAHYRFI